VKEELEEEVAKVKLYGASGGWFHCFESGRASKM
jgi:hypothetical protein